MGKKILVLTGPTAVGKTRAALELAAKYGLEIISADSRQIYRYLDIGTAKPSRAEQSRIPHHLIDIKNPDEYFSAGDYLEKALPVIHRLDTEGKKYIIVGGSGFYINALLLGSVNQSISAPQIRENLKLRLSEEGADRLYAELAAHDPDSARRIHPHDQYRIVRALEIIYSTGQPVQKTQNKNMSGDFSVIGLTTERSLLYQKIDQRVDAMIAEGLEDEAKQLLAMGYRPDLPSLKTLGYREVFDFLAGKTSRETMLELIKKNTRNYAKRQMTWFNKQDLTWLDLTDKTDTQIDHALDAQFNRLPN
jgi:tRNA dimethylallyltransferase